MPININIEIEIILSLGVHVNLSSSPLLTCIVVTLVYHELNNKNEILAEILFF